jgi:hypothetical protein
LGLVATGHLHTAWCRDAQHVHRDCVIPDRYPRNLVFDNRLDRCYHALGFLLSRCLRLDVSPSTILLSVMTTHNYTERLPTKLFVMIFTSTLRMTKHHQSPGMTHHYEFPSFADGGGSLP